MGLSYLTVYRGRITITYTKDYKTLRVSTGFECTSRDFSKKKQEILPSSDRKDRDYVNAEILEQKDKIDKLIKYCKATYGDVNVDRLKKMIANPPVEKKGDAGDDLISLFQEFIDIKKPGATNKVYNLKNHLSRFIGTDKIKPEQVDLRFLNDFEDFLRKTNGANSAKKYFNILKSFYKYLVRYKGQEINIAIRDKKIIGEESFFVVLTDEQVADLRDFIPYSKSQERVKDIFMILLLTGMSWTDYENCTFDPDQKLIQGYRKKSKTPFKVPLHDEVIEILNKTDGKKPLLAGPTFNRQLKSLLSRIPSYRFLKTKRGKEIPFYNLVSSHTGRHTFIDRGLRRNFPIQMLMTFVGHKSPQQLLEYAKKHLTTKEDFQLINQL